MTLATNNRTIKGVAQLKLKRIRDGAILNLPTPTNFVIENGIEEKILTTQNNLGEMTRATSYIKGRMPVVQIVYNFLQPEILQFKTGREFEAKTAILQTPRSFQVIQANYPPITDTTKIGYNVVTDAVSQASVTRNQLSFQLVQQPFASFDGTVNDTFAIGARFEVKFSNNLVTAIETVSMIVPETFSGYGIGDLSVSQFQIKAAIVTTLNEVIIFTADNVTSSFNGANIDTGADNIQIPFFINDVPGSCFAYEWFYTQKYISC